MSVRSSAEQGHVGFQKGELPHYRSPRAGPGMLVAKWYRGGQNWAPRHLDSPTRKEWGHPYILICSSLSNDIQGLLPNLRTFITRDMATPMVLTTASQKGKFWATGSSGNSRGKLHFSSECRLWNTMSTTLFFNQIGMTAAVSLPSTPVWIPTLTQIWNYISGCSWHTCT